MQPETVDQLSLTARLREFHTEHTVGDRSQDPPRGHAPAYAMQHGTTLRWFRDAPSTMAGSRKPRQHCLALPDGVAPVRRPVTASACQFSTSANTAAARVVDDV